MKKILSLFFVVLVLISCSSDNDNTGQGLSNTPQAKAQFDNNNYGIYKGVFVGSSGIVLININNEGSLTATIVIDGVSYVFTTTETVTEGTVITGLTFTSGTSSFDFNVGANGSGPFITNLNITGHPNANIDIIKEFSDALVMCFQGTYGGDDSGVFNLITQSGNVYGLAKSNGGTESIYLEGTISTSTITGIFTGGTFSGTLTGNSIGGNWQNSILETGTWSGQRTL